MHTTFRICINTTQSQIPNMLHITIAILFFGCAVVVQCSGEKLSMAIYQSGFHRTLRYDTYFLQPWRPEPCDFVLKHSLPSGVYVDTNQLDNLVRLNQLNYFTDAKVNVESIQSKAQPFDIYVYGDTATMHTINLPIHFRYHAPGEQSFVKVHIDEPRMYLNCSGFGQNSEEMQHSNDQQSDGAMIIRCKEPSTRLMANGIPTFNQCKWIPIEYELHSDTVEVSLPIGTQSVEPLVTFVTTAIAWTACYYISLSVYYKAKELRVKQE